MEAFYESRTQAYLDFENNRECSLPRFWVATFPESGARKRDAESGVRKPESVILAVFACSCFVIGPARTGHVLRLSNAYRAVDRAFYCPSTSVSIP